MKQIITKTIDIQGFKKGISIGLGIILALATSAILAVAVTGTINTFSSGNVVDASQINTNFASLKTAIEGIPNWKSNGTSAYYNDGNVGIGTSSPAAPLDVAGNIKTSGSDSDTFSLIQRGGIDVSSSGTGSYIDFKNTSAVDYDFRMIKWAAASRFDIISTSATLLSMAASGNVGIGATNPTALLHVAGTAGNTSGTWSNLSDERLKKNIFDYKGSLEKVLNLRPVSFEWKENKEGKTAGRHIGFIAQEVEKIFPEWVSTMSDGNKWMTPEGMNAVLVQSIRELKSLYDNEKSENAKLKQKLLSVEERLNALEKRK